MTEGTEQEKIIGGRILFVDDEENILKAMRRLFMDDAYEVYIANSGKEALKILKEEGEMGVIVSDQRMPEMTGVDFLEKSKKLSPQTVRILLTGYADINAAVDAINRGGAFRYLHKPWKDEELIQTVQAAFKYYKLVKENKRLTALVLKQNQQLKNWNIELETIVQEQTMELSNNNDSLKRLNKKLYKNFRNTILAFSSLLEMRDKSMRCHSHNIAEVVRVAAAGLEMDNQEIDDLVAASFLHDIGKIAMPSSMPHTDESKMSQQERQEYSKHSVRGQTVVDGIDDLRAAGKIIRHHHERFDGLGFPDNLKKNEIPLGARLITIADFIDNEMRRHSGGNAMEKVFKLVEADAGRTFDPKLIPKVLKAAEIFYRKNQQKFEFSEKELRPKDLTIDMVVSRDVLSGTGVLLLSKGTPLTTKNIDILKRYYQVDPANQGIFVSLIGKDDEEKTLKAP